MHAEIQPLESRQYLSNPLSSHAIPKALTGSVVIEHNAKYTSKSLVTVELTAPDGATQMYVGTSPTASRFVPFKSTATIRIDRTHDTVFARYRTPTGALSTVVKDSIIFDNQKPILSSAQPLDLDRNPVTTLYGDMLYMKLTAKDLGDAGLGAAQFRTSAKGTWTAWQPFKSPLPVDLPAGQQRLTVQMRIRDRAGNISSTLQRTIDHKRYHYASLKWIQNNLSASTSLVASNRNSSLSDWAFTYDQAIAAQAAIAAGELHLASQILAGILVSIPTRLGGYINAATLSSFGGQEWQVTTGPNAHVGLALLRYADAAGDRQYITKAQQMGDYLLTYANTSSAEFSYGGIPFGPPGEPGNPADQHFGWSADAPAFADVYSTEHQIDAWLLLRQLPGAKYQQAANRLLTFIGKLYDPATGLFDGGYNQSTETLDKTIPTDVQAWAVSALGPTRIEQITGHSITDFFTHLDQRTKVNASGYDFLARSSGKLISVERSLQVALAKQTALPSITDSTLRNQYHQDAQSLITAFAALERSGPLHYAYSPNLSPADGQDTGLGFVAQTGDSGISHFYLLCAQLNHDPMHFAP